MLDSYVQKAEVKDGTRILDLGCGGGSLSLYQAERFPKCSITAFSNSRTQRVYIEGEAAKKNLSNLEVVTSEVVTHEFPPSHCDRVLSIELFEHIKNYGLPMAKVSRTLKPGGKLFGHIFAYKESPYDFEDGWMSTHFFTGVRRRVRICCISSRRISH
jgi:cyclopropane fatty-acyl-phospholipid synthase-like methyltransferase